MNLFKLIKKDRRNKSEIYKASKEKININFNNSSLVLIENDEPADDSICKNVIPIDMQFNLL